MDFDPGSDRQKEKRIRRVTWIGCLINVALSVVKLTAGVLGNSQAVVADGLHSLSDLTTDIAVIAGSYYWGKPPDKEHPYGHRRIETMVSIFIGAVLITAGAGIGVEAVLSIGKDDAVTPGWIAFMAASLSVVVKEGLYRWTAKTGNTIKSISLSANAWHHRLDALSSIPVVAAVGLMIFFPSLIVLDRMAAAVISVLIILTALKIIFSGLKELMDAGAPYETCQTIKKMALENPAVHQVHGIRTRYAGNSLQVDLHIVIDGSITVSRGHDVAEAVKQKLVDDGPDVVDVVVHIEPIEAARPQKDCEY